MHCEPAAAQTAVKRDYWAIFDDIGAAPGTTAVAETEPRAAEFERKCASSIRAQSTSCSVTSAR